MYLSVFVPRVRKIAQCLFVFLLVQFCRADDVTLSWDPSPDPNVMAYRVYYGAVPGIYTGSVEVQAPATTAVVPTLLSGTTYYSAVSVDRTGVESSFSNVAIFDLLLNTAPTALALSASTPQDTAVGVMLRGSDADGDLLTYTIATPPLNGTLTGVAPNLVYTPRANFLGTDTFAYTVSDGVGTATALVTITVAPNAAPTINAPAGIVLAQNAGPQVVGLTGISAGAANETQTVTVSAKSSNTSLIPTPTVTYLSPSTTGTLAFTPILNAIGWSTITLTVSDGSLVSTQNFWVLVNNPPTLNSIGNISVNEDSGAKTVALSGISSGATNETQTLSIGATSSNPALIPNPTVSYTSPNSTGSLIFTPAANASGTATITVTAKDNQYANNSLTRSFTVTVNSLNDAPTLSAIGNISVLSSSGTRTVSLSGISSGAANEGQTLTITATSSNPTLIPTPTISYASPSTTGSLKFTPVLNSNGTATISVTVSDGQTSTTRSFTVTVTSPPKITNLSAAALDARTIKVTWNTDKTATGVVGYGTTTTVYSAQTYGTSHSVTLTNLLVGTLYYLQVQATAGGGTTTIATNVATEALRVVQWAAESGWFSGSVKVSTSTRVANVTYIENKVIDPTSSASYELNLGRGPNYQMWARVLMPVGGGSLMMSTDASAERSVYISDNGSTNDWHWALVTDNDNRTNAISLAAESGAHTFTIRPDTRQLFDEFIVVNDPTWKPVLPTTRPTLSVTRTGTTATLSWVDPSGNATLVSLEYSTDGVNFSPFSTAAATSTSLNVGNLAAQTYYFRMYSYNSLDRTGYSNVAVAL